MLRNSKDKVLLLFSKNIGVCDSNEADVLAILEAPRMFSGRYHGRAMVESDSSNTIA